MNLSPAIIPMQTAYNLAPPPAAAAMLISVRPLKAVVETTSQNVHAALASRIRHRPPFESSATSMYSVDADSAQESPHKRGRRSTVAEWADSSVDNSVKGIQRKSSGLLEIAAVNEEDDADMAAVGGGGDWPHSSAPLNPLTLPRVLCKVPTRAPLPVPLTLS